MSSNRVVDLPPQHTGFADGSVPGGWWHDVGDGRMICDLCPRACNLKPGDRGFCFVRQNRDGEMALTTYGKSTGFCIDPIEKKPLNHFFPGTSVLSFGTAGCNLGCKFCQNHDISKAREVERLSEHAAPEAIARAAVKLGCKSVAYTYNDPVIWAEYAIDTAKACRAVGIKSVAVTAGYISPQARAPFFEYFDAANIDLKAFTEEFYEQLTLSHLQPVLDTLRWLKTETDVWFEITNLIIPDANDSADELGRLCDWILDQIGDEVPVHFSAFHPDFHMLDRPRTPHETLLKAHEIAQSNGLKHVYVGNVHDAHHQSTYCSQCGELLIERDWYALGRYHLNGNQCEYCDHRLPGHFEDQPGSWGRRREPVQIARFAAEQPNEEKAMSKRKTAAKSRAPTMGGPSPFSADQQEAILAGASEVVAAAVTGQTPALQDETLQGAGSQKVMGVYVSLKRKGRLRGCCGFTGSRTTIVEGIKYAAARTACEDPRLPPVSATELPYLDVEVWLLQGLIPVTAEGADRENEVMVGRDGLLIQRGNQRGLLLPGVATDNGWDAATFLSQVSLKAKLTPTAWREADSDLFRFEGTSVAGPFCHGVAKQTAIEPTPIVDSDSIQMLADFCRQNVHLLDSGALPNYYSPGVGDGMVNGAVLVAKHRDGTTLSASRISLRPPMPLQSTLFSLCEEVAKRIQQLEHPAQDYQLDLLVLEDPSMHGTTGNPDLRGAEPTRCVLILAPNRSSGVQFNPGCSVEETVNELSRLLDFRPDQAGNIFSFRSEATSTVQLTNTVQPQTGPNVRQPAVAGKFYPATAKAISSMVRGLIPDPLPPKEKFRAAMVPHAGLPFSGRIAADVMARIDFPKRIIVIGPKHTRSGVDWAVAPHDTWHVPGIEISNDTEMATRLVENIEHLQLDAAAHHSEHAIEVELPLLHHFAPKSKVVGIAIGSGNLAACHDFASGLARTIVDTAGDVIVLISSDMNHFASDAETRRLDEIALRAIEQLNPDEVFRTVRENEISMCGLLPAVITLRCLNQIEPLTKALRVSYATSADVTGEKGRVVGYAGMLFA